MSPATLLRLYPRAWRERYGEEMIALLEQRRLGWGDLWDVCRAAFAERWATMTSKSANETSMFYGAGDLAREVTCALRAHVPWRAAVPWGLALGVGFPVRGLYELLAARPAHALDVLASGPVGVLICFCAGLYTAWRRRDFSYGGVVALTAIVIAFIFAVVVNVALVLVIAQLRPIDLRRSLYGAIEVPLPIMLMLGGFAGTIGAAIGRGLSRFHATATLH